MNWPTVRCSILLVSILSVRLDLHPGHLLYPYHLKRSFGHCIPAQRTGSFALHSAGLPAASTPIACCPDCLLRPPLLVLHCHGCTSILPNQPIIIYTLSCRYAVISNLFDVPACPPARAAPKACWPSRHSGTHDSSLAFANWDRSLLLMSLLTCDPCTTLWDHCKPPSPCQQPLKC